VADLVGEGETLTPHGNVIAQEDRGAPATLLKPTVFNEREAVNPIDAQRYRDALNGDRRPGIEAKMLQ